MTFITERLPLACYIHATDALKLIGCNRTSPYKVEFVFDDPGNQGDTLELNFERGATAPATAIFASQRYLRRMMTSELEQRNTITRKGNDRHSTAIVSH